MNPLNVITRPARDLTQALVMPVRFLFVVGLCGFINWMTFSGQWWVKWVAFGMTMAVLLAWARAARTLALLGLLAFGGWWVYKRYGAVARRRFDARAATTNPDANSVVNALRAAAAGFGNPIAAPRPHWPARSGA